MKWTTVKHPKCEVVLRVKIPTLMHDTHLCQNMLNLLIANRTKKKSIQNMLFCKHMRISHICQIQRDQTLSLNSYRVMNSHRAIYVHTAESPDPVI